MIGLVLAFVGLPGTASAVVHRDQLRVGSLILTPCHVVTQAWCGWRPEPLDPSEPAGPKLRIGFVWYPATGTSSPQGTIVAEEGGPGWASSGSAPEYRALYRPLLATRNLLLVDSRGTGRSAAIVCPRLERYRGSTDGPAFDRLVGDCGNRLNHTWRSADGRWIHASDLFSTAYAVNDLADIIRALRVAPVDLYGDSYGTWFAQSFLSRHADLLRSVVLDSAYPMFGGSAWYPSSYSAAKRALRLVCERDLACQRDAGGDPWARLSELVSRVRGQPIQGETTDPNGKAVWEHVYVRTLINLVTNAGFDPIVYRELDAAVRAALAGDMAPILRLAALADYYDNANPKSAHAFSDGLYFSVSCSEYSQLFRMKDPPAMRRRELAARIAATDPTLFSPFTPAEWGRINQYSEAYEACLDWPSLDPQHRVSAAGHAPPLAPPKLPVLVLGGDLDSWTSAGFQRPLLEQLGPSARYVELLNTVHTSAEGDTPSAASTACARSLVRAFVTEPDQLFSLNTSCAAKVPPVHTPGAFPLKLDDEAPAAVVSGHVGIEARRATVVAAESLGDVMMSWYVDSGNAGAGLRGGRFFGTGWPVAQLRLRSVRWVSNATVSGAGTWDVPTGRVRGSLVVRGPNGLHVSVTVSWSEWTPWASGRLPSGATVRFPAP